MMFCRKTILNIFFVMWLFFLAKGEEELVCDISSACDNKLPGTKIEDPFDCHKYYICVTNVEGNVIVSDAVITCSTGYYFNDEQQDCLVEDFKCRNKCDNLFCTRSCDNVPDGTQIAYPNECSKFRVCAQDSEPIVGECSSETPYFDGTNCTNDVNSCCDICTPYCEVAFTEVEDPFDCYSFYLCQSNDYIPESEHFTCETGKYYNVTEGDCVDSNGTTCNSICNWFTTTVLTTRTTTWIYTTQTSRPISTSQNLTSTFISTEAQSSSAASSLPSKTTWFYTQTSRPISTNQNLTSTFVSTEVQSSSAASDLPSKTTWFYTQTSRPTSTNEALTSNLLSSEIQPISEVSDIPSETSNTYFTESETRNSNNVTFWFSTEKP